MGDEGRWIDVDFALYEMRMHRRINHVVVFFFYFSLCLGGFAATVLLHFIHLL